MKGKAFYCSNCRKKMGTHFSATSLADIKKELNISDAASSSDKKSNDYADKIKSEKTDTFGKIVLIPCMHCGADNFFNKK